MTFAHGIALYCECGDQLIHQNSRGAHESSSLLGQHVHDRYPQRFDYMDIDALIWKASRRRLVIIEHKYPGQTVRASQRRILPLLGDLVQLGVDHGLLRGGYVVLLYGAPPFQSASVTRWPGAHHEDLDQVHIDRLLQGEQVHCQGVQP